MKYCKKVILILFSYFWCLSPLLAYSENIVPGGKNIGITINSEGLIVVGFYKVNDKYLANDKLKVGDVILKVNGIEINNINELSNIISENITNNKVDIEIKRNNKLLNIELDLVYEDNMYKTGLYIKDKITGIGTLTYIDPITKIYGALGHEILLSDTGKRVEVKTGDIYESYVNSIDRSSNGTVGSKNATILYDNKVGTIIKNTEFGIFGKYNDILEEELIKVANFNEIKVGEATIKTIIEGDNIKEYKINIIDTDRSKINTTKSILFLIEDQNLLENTGGIVQGMSGSPIIQNNKIIGAVTNVVVDDVQKGYGIFIRTMLEEGER